MTTVTHVTSGQIVTTLTLRVASPSIEELVEKMLASGVCSDEVKRQVLQWKADVIKYEQPEDIAVALYYLMNNVVYPAISSSDEEEALQLLAFEDEIKVLLTQYIPKEMSVDQYIKERLEEQDLIDECAAIDAIFQLQMDQLQSTANAVNQQMASADEAMERRRLEVSTTRRDQNAQLTDEAHALRDKVHLLEKRAIESASSSIKVGKEFNAQQESMQGGIEEDLPS